MVVKLCAEAKDGSFVPILEMRENEEFPGVCIIGETGAPQAFLKDEENDKIIVLDITKVIYLLAFPRPGEFLLGKMLDKKLREEILENPSKFSMVKIFEKDNINAFACYDLFLMSILSDDYNIIGNILSRNEEIKQRVLSGFALWTVEYTATLRCCHIESYAPCHTDLLTSSDIARQFENEQRVEVGGDYYYFSDHPFYRDFFILVKLNEGKAREISKDAAKKGIDFVYPKLRQTLDEEIREKDRGDLIELFFTKRDQT